MSRLLKIADVLTSYAKGGAPGDIPKVHFQFTHDPTDIAEIEGWKLKVTLSASGEVDDHGNVVPHFEKFWEVSGNSDDDCAQKVEVELLDFLKSALTLKELERTAVEGALNMLSAEASPSDLWVQDSAQAGEIEKKADDGQGWSHDTKAYPHDGQGWSHDTKAYPQKYISPPDES